MNYPAQLGFYKLDDVYVTLRDVIFAIVQLFGTLAVIPRLLGQRKFDAGLIKPNFSRQAQTSGKHVREINTPLYPIFI